jgi:putative ABC transport system permease protein
MRAIIGLAPTSVPLLERVSLDGRALVFAVLATSATTLLFGVWPARRAAGTASSPLLTANSRTVVGKGNRYRSAMVVLATSLSMVLVAGFGLLLRSFIEIQGASLGFNPAPVWTAKVSLGHSRFADGALRQRYWDSLWHALKSEPALESAGLVWPLPFTGQGAEVPYDAVGGDAPDWGRFVAFTPNAFPGYLETMQATVLDGRVFEERDLRRAGELAVVDELVAARLYPDGRAVGRTVWIEDFGTKVRQPTEIIGVVSHIRHSRIIGAEREVIYRLVPTARNLAIVVRAAGGPTSPAAVLRRIAGALDPDVPIFDERPLAGYVDDQVAPARYTTTMAAVFGAVALLMAMIGLYGVISYSMSRRTAELGLRMALGAGSDSIVGLVMRRGLTLTGAGILIGGITSLAVGKAIRGLLVEVPDHDLSIFGATAMVLTVAALGATYVPARRAARLDPVAALREE